MARTPHTSCRRGQRVEIVLKSGDKFTDKFVDRTGKYIVLESYGRIRGKDIKGFNPIKGGGEHMGISKQDRDTIKLQRERSAATLGMPKPSQTHGGGTRKNQRIRDYSLDSIPAENFVTIHPHPDAPIIGAPRLSTVSQLNITPSSTRIQPRDYHPVAPVRQYSQEEIANMNFQRETVPTPSPVHSDIGEAAANAVAKGISNAPVQGGTIEAALEEAKRKAKHYRHETQRCQMEAERWNAVVDSLNAALGIATSKTPASVSARPLTSDPSKPAANALKGAGQRPRGFWRKAIPSLLRGNGSPMSRSMLITELMNATGSSRDNVQQAYYKLLREGVIFDSGNEMIALPEWTSPSKVEAEAK
jgi:hypothetical protein